MLLRKTPHRLNSFKGWSLEAGDGGIGLRGGKGRTLEGCKVCEQVLACDPEERSRSVTCSCGTTSRRGRRKAPRALADSEYVTMGDETEAAEYLHEFARYLLKDHHDDLVRVVMKPDSPFRLRFDRCFSFKERSDEIRGFPVGEQRIADTQKILDGDGVRALLRESEDTIVG